MALKINYINESYYNKMILTKGVLIGKFDNSCIYDFGNNRVLKDYNYNNMPYADEERNFVLLLYQKVLCEISRITDFDELIKAEKLYIVNGMLKGQVMPKISNKYINIESYIDTCGNDISKICDCFLNLNKIFNKGNKYNLVFGDAITEGNIKFNVEEKRFKLLDGEGMQINKIFPLVVSDLLHLDNPHMKNKYLKYRDIPNLGTIGYLTQDINTISILTLFIHLCTKYICLTSYYDNMTFEECGEFNLEILGLKDDDILAPIIRQIYKNGKVPEIENERWKLFGQTYQLVPQYYRLYGTNQIGEGRVFSKK